MSKAPVTAVILSCVMLTGCVLSGKAAKTAAATPPPPPKPVVAAPPPPQPTAPLSIPQTQIELPKPQVVDPAALAAEPPLEQPQEQTPRTQQRRNAGPPSRPAETTAPPPPTTTPSASPAALPPGVTPPEAPSAPIQEIIPAVEQKRLQEHAVALRSEAKQIVDQFTRRTPRLSPQQKDAVTHIYSFLQDSVEAEGKGDMKQAEALAGRAQVLAKDLVNPR